MARKSKKQAPLQVASISGNKAIAISGEEITIPTLSQLRKKYGALVDGMECPRTRISHAKKALSYGSKVTVDSDGLIAIFGWDWHAAMPITLSAVKGLKGPVRGAAIAMMQDSGFMGKEPRSADGLVDADVRKLY